MDLSSSAPFLNVRLFFSFNSEFYDRGKINYFLLASQAAAGAFFMWNNTFLVLERCRRRLSWTEDAFLVLEPCRRRFFFGEKMRFWSWNVAAGAFFWWKIAVFVLERCRRRLFLMKKCGFGPGTLPQAPFWNGKPMLVLERCRRRLFQTFFAFPRSTPHSWPTLKWDAGKYQKTKSSGIWFLERCRRRLFF